MNKKGSVFILVLILINIMFLLFGYLGLIIENEAQMVNYNFQRLQAVLAAETALIEALFSIKNSEIVSPTKLENISGTLEKADYEIKKVSIKEEGVNSFYKITSSGNSGKINHNLSIKIKKIN